MKTGILRKTLVIASVVLGSTFVLTSCEKNDDNMNNNTTTYAISGNASGNQVVPAVSGNGSGTITGTYNRNTRVLTYTSTWTNLSGAPTSAAFYSGATGTAGTTAGTTWSLGSGLTGTGTVTGTMTLTADQEAQLLNGGWYYSYGTSANPNGEVRGQIAVTAQ